MVLVSEDFAVKNNLKPLARIMAVTSAGVDPRTMGIGPVPALGKDWLTPFFDLLLEMMGLGKALTERVLERADIDGQHPSDDFFERAPLHALGEGCQTLALPRLHRRTCFDDDVAHITKPRRLFVAQGDKHVCRQLSRACAHLNEHERFTAKGFTP